ncbi:MAG TPA: RNA-binding protein [Flavisolibacter sp.]|nr:RNA-binding protein [Flavisolibacter sp.]
MNIHISNLSSSIIEGDLSKLFTVYGEVSFIVIVRSKNGRSKGDAFIEMPIRSQAEQAVRALHLTELDGLRISVKEIEYRAGEFNN